MVIIVLYNLFQILLRMAGVWRINISGSPHHLCLPGHRRAGKISAAASSTEGETITAATTTNQTKTGSDF